MAVSGLYVCLCVCVYVCVGGLCNANLHCRTVLSVAWFRQVLLVVIFGPRAQGIDGSCNREPAVHHEHVSKFLFFKKRERGSEEVTKDQHPTSSQFLARRITARTFGEIKLWRRVDDLGRNHFTASTVVVLERCLVGYLACLCQLLLLRVVTFV